MMKKVHKQILIRVKRRHDWYSRKERKTENRRWGGSGMMIWIPIDVGLGSIGSKLHRARNKFSRITSTLPNVTLCLIPRIDDFATLKDRRARKWSVRTNFQAEQNFNRPKTNLREETKAFLTIVFHVTSWSRRPWTTPRNNSEETSKGWIRVHMIYERTDWAQEHTRSKYLPSHLTLWFAWPLSLS